MMHGHISYVTQRLGELSCKPLNDENEAALRSMRMMLVRGLETAAEHDERSSRLSLIQKIDKYLNAMSAPVSGS